VAESKTRSWPRRCDEHFRGDDPDEKLVLKYYCWDCLLTQWSETHDKAERRRINKALNRSGYRGLTYVGP